MHQQSLNLIKQLITHNNLILLILEVVRNYILFNYVYPVFDRISVIWLSTREHAHIHEEACARHSRTCFFLGYHWTLKERNLYCSSWRILLYYRLFVDQQFSPETSELTISSGAKALPPLLSVPLLRCNDAGWCCALRCAFNINVCGEN